jgi:hypothetical protein
MKSGGESQAATMQQTFQELEANRKPQGCVFDTADGFLISLLTQEYSFRELRELFKVGAYRLQRLKDEMKDPGLRSRKLEKKTPSHAFTEEEKQVVLDLAKTWNDRLEDGFPCAHRRQMRFFLNRGYLGKNSTRSMLFTVRLSTSKQWDMKDGHNTSIITIQILL